MLPVCSLRLEHAGCNPEGAAPFRGGGMAPLQQFTMS